MSAEPYVMSKERAEEIAGMIEWDEAGRIWLAEGVTQAQCAGAIYDFLSERSDRAAAVPGEETQ